MKSAGIFRSLSAVALALASALLVISVLEPLMSFEAASTSETTLSIPGAKWTEVMENLPDQAYLWLALVYAVGSFTAGFICFAIGRTYSLLQYVSVALSLLMLIHLSYTPNPLWFWLVAVAATGLPVFAPHLINVIRKIKA